jgi:hypothetical protein
VLVWPRLWEVRAYRRDSVRVAHTKQQDYHIFLTRTDSCLITSCHSNSSVRIVHFLWHISTSNTDVFFALKGGSNNFGMRFHKFSLYIARSKTDLGIVTHVTLRTYAVAKVWGGALIYTNDHRDEIMRAFATYQQSGQLDTKSALLSYMGITNNTNYVILVYLDEIERPTAFKPFFDISIIFDGTHMHDNFTDIISEQVDRVVPRWTLGATTYYLDEVTNVDVGRIAQNASALLSSINGGSMVLMPEPISQSMVTESTSRGASPMVSSLNATAQMWLCQHRLELCRRRC